MPGHPTMLQKTDYVWVVQKEKRDSDDEWSTAGKKIAASFRAALRVVDDEYFDISDGAVEAYFHAAIVDKYSFVDPERDHIRATITRTPFYEVTVG